MLEENDPRSPRLAMLSPHRSDSGVEPIQLDYRTNHDPGIKTGDLYFGAVVSRIRSRGSLFALLRWPASKFGNCVSEEN